MYNLEEYNVSFLWLNLFGRVELRRCGEPATSCPHRSPQLSEDAAQRTYCLRFSTRGDAADWLQGVLARGDDVAALRQVLELDQRALAWLSNRQVVEQVADQIVRRDLCVVAEQPRARDTQVRVIVEPPPVMRTGTPLSLPRESLPIAPPVQEFNFEDALNQSLQAKALEDAAAAGVPFCEECEKAKKAIKAA